MSTEVIATIILLGSFFLLIFLGNHILFSIGVSTLITILYLEIPLQTVAQQTVRGLNSFSLMAVPFFILFGDIMSAGGITDKLVRMANACVGWMRGGLAMVNCVDSMFFGGISGSPTADVAGFYYDPSYGKKRIRQRVYLCSDNVQCNSRPFDPAQP